MVDLILTEVSWDSWDPTFAISIQEIGGIWKISWIKFKDGVVSLQCMGRGGIHD